MIAKVWPARAGSGSSPVSSRRRFFFFAKIALAASSASGATTTSVKISADRLGSRRVERAIDGDDSAEGRNAVAGERLRPGVDERVAGRDAARIGVLDDDHGRRPGAELGGELERGVGVVQIVVAELLALDLLGLGDAARGRSDRHIERRLLMRILAVAQRHLQRAGAGPAGRPALALVGEGEPLRDGRIVGGSQRKGLGREPLAELAGRPTVGTSCSSKAA